MKTYSDQIKIMGLSMFLGLSCGKWFPEHIPTLEDPSLLLVYKGRERHGRPMKILNAAARPPKKYRFTQYFNTSVCKLEEQTIYLTELREDVTAQDVVDAFGACLKNAEQVILYRQHNATKAQRTLADPNRDLRRTVKRLMKQILGPSFKLSMAKNNGLVEATISDGVKTMVIAESTERDALVNMVKAITSQGVIAK